MKYRSSEEKVYQGGLRNFLGSLYKSKKMFCERDFLLGINFGMESLKLVLDYGEQSLNLIK